MVSGIPKAEKIWANLISDSKENYYITSKENDRSMYFIYKLVNGKAVKLGKGKDPKELETKYSK